MFFRKQHTAHHFFHIILGIFICSAAFTQETVSPKTKVIKLPVDTSYLSNYVSRSWNSADGLPGNTITNIMQDKKGYIYIGTYDGLVRFDGIEFRTYNHTKNPKYGFVSARSLLQDTNGNIWVGSNDEGITCIAQDGQVLRFSTDNGLPNNSVRAITEDFEGNIWAGTASGVAYITPSHEVVIPEGLAAYNEENILTQLLYCDTTGRIWLTSAKANSIYVYNEHRFIRYEGITSIQKPVVTAIAQDRTGAFWFGVAPFYAVKIDGSMQSVFDIGHGKQPGTIINSIFQDRENNIWFGMDSGVSVVHSGMISYYDRETGLADDNVNKVLEDNEGNIWFATDRGGIEKMSLSKFKTINIGTTINAIAEDSRRGLVWMGADNGLYCFTMNLERVENEVTRTLSDIRIRHVAMTKKGELLVSTYEKFGQAIVHQDGTIEAITKDKGLAGNKVRVAVEISNGDIYVGTTTGLSIIERRTGRITNITKADGIQNEYIMCIFESPDGSIWVGTDGGGIFQLKDKKVTQSYTSENGLAGNVIFKILSFRDNEVWICTGTGVTRVLDGKIFNYNSGNGLPTDSQFQIIRDISDTLWLTNSRGITSAKLSDFDSVMAGAENNLTVKSYGLSDGLRTGGVTSTSLSMRDSLERIWFTLIDGVAVYDPIKAKSNHTKPQIELQDIFVDDDPVENTGEIILSPETKRIDISYTGLSFISSEQIRFSHRLEGFDDKYSDWSLPRSVSYTNLPPGKYTFTVMALSANDIVSDVSSKLVIIKKPYFWQLWWFWAIVAMTVIMIVVVSIWSYFERLKRYQRQLEKEVAEKTFDLKKEKEALEEEKNRSERLLLNILPRNIAQELSKHPNAIIARQHDYVTVLFADIVGFTKMSSKLSANEVVNILNRIFTLFDLRADREGIEKIKTIGDCYMAATGLTDIPDVTAAPRMVEYARHMFQDLEKFNRSSPIKISIRIGINTGELIAGVIGKTKFIYDIWGDTVNVASRMESSGRPGYIHVTQATYDLTKDKFNYGQGEIVEIKGKGNMTTYFTT